MGMTAAVAGASGYAGGELLRLLLAHPELSVGPVAAGSSAGRPVTDLHPQLVSLADRSFTATDAAVLAEADIVFLALPHGESAAIAAAGCYPTSVALALAPLLAGGAVEPDDLVVVASSGTSGAGRAAKAGLLGSEVMGDVSAYKVGAHQHTPEIRQTLGRFAGTDVRLSFTPVLAPMPRGILATCTAGTHATEDELRALLVEKYADEPFVHVLPAGRWPHTAATAGTNACHLQVTVDRDAGRAVVVSAIDNLGKGAAGQAVQCANLALGLPETAGLTADGIAP